MNKIIFSFTLFNVCVLSLYAQNPIADYYGLNEGYPSWTDEIRWQNKINMADYPFGKNDFEKFEHARDSLHRYGGGVLFYPGGEYTFEDIPADHPNGRGLMLKSGVVILGQQPEKDKNAHEGKLSLPTVFRFPYKDIGPGEVPHPWNIIGLMPDDKYELKNIKNVGLAWIDIQGATIYFGAQFSWGETYASSGAWYSKRAEFGIWPDRIPDGTHPIDPFAGTSPEKKFIGAGNSLFVFGCKVRDAAVHNPKIIDYSEGGDFKYHTYKFGARISIYGSNVFVANNLLPKSNKNFMYEQKTAITRTDHCNQVFGTENSLLIYDYGKTFGIDVNKSFFNDCINKNDGYFQEGVVVRDNYVYNHGSKGFDVSGNWLVVMNNHNERDYLEEGVDVYNLPGSDEWELTLDGYFQSVQGGNGCLSDNLARAFDMAGKNAWIEGNSWNNLGSNPGNDGESILSQRHGGTDILSWAVTHNTLLPSYSYANTGYLCGYDVHNYGMLVAWNNTKSTVGNRKAGDLVDCAFIPGTKSERVLIDYSVNDPDVLSKCPDDKPAPPLNVEIKRSSNGNYVEISWKDNTDNEIGYRIDRKMAEADEWVTIAYRPRQSTQHAMNEAKWKDYLAPYKNNYVYRVVAVNCANNETGAGKWLSVQE